MPVQRGAVTATDSFGSPAVAAPDGLSAADVVDLVVYSEGTDPDWSLAGFTRVVNEQSTDIHLTVLRGTIGVPPADFTPVAATPPGYWAITCTAWSDGDAAGTVVGDVYAGNPFGVDVAVPGITAAAGSLVASISAERFGGLAAPSGWATVAGSTSVRIYSDDISGPTGDITQTPGNGFQPVAAVLISLPPLSVEPVETDADLVVSFALTASARKTVRSDASMALGITAATAPGKVGHAAADVELGLDMAGAVAKAVEVAAAFGISIDLDALARKSAGSSAALSLVLALAAIAGELGEPTMLRVAVVPRELRVEAVDREARSVIVRVEHRVLEVSQ